MTFFGLPGAGRKGQVIARAIAVAGVGGTLMSAGQELAAFEDMLEGAA